MNILIDINHPAQVHFFKNLYFALKSIGNNVFVTVKDLPSAKVLLKAYNIRFFEIGKKRDSIIGKLIKQAQYFTNIFRIVKENNISIGLGSSITIDHVSKVSKMKSLHFGDDDAETVPLTIKYAYPFADSILSPDVVIFEKFRHKNIQYAGYHELAYLHPNGFTPDPSVLQEAGLKEGEKYFLLRFNSFKAHHDVGVRGLSIESKKKLVSLLSYYGQVFITTEREIDPEFEQYNIKIASHKIHSFIYYATMLIGDSQTMTSEAAVLGVPSIRSNSFVGRISYLEEQEHKYGLTFGFKPDDTERMFLKIKELLSMPDLREEWQKRRQKMLADKIDVTAFMFWFVENYPDSVKVMKENPDYQYRFK